MKLVTVDEMRRVEKAANAGGMTYEEMMANAGQKLAEIIGSRYVSQKSTAVSGLVGPGNNGGDTLIALTLLQKSGWKTSAWLVKDRTNDPRVKNYLDAGGSAHLAGGHSFSAELKEAMKAPGLVLDGVLGTGATLPLKDEVKKFLKMAGESIQGQLVIAVDCPSGVDCESGEAAPETLKADLTVCMEAVKVGLVKMPAFMYCGEIVTAAIGLDKEMEVVSNSKMVIDADWVKSILPARPADAHKGTFGMVMVVGGCTNYVGAPLLAGKAAYRVGSGLVTMAVPQSIHAMIAGQLPEAVWLVLDDEGGVIAESAAEVILPHVSTTEALVIGPGIGREETTKRFLDAVLLQEAVNGKGRRMGFLVEEGMDENPKNCQLPPTVIDADGLRWLADTGDWYEKIGTRLVLTPHPGEMAALTGLSIDEIQKDRLGVAASHAKKWNQVVLLKGALTVITAPDGSLGVIPVASAALAKAGSGDVLSGVIASLMGQNMPPFEAACAGAWIHAHAGLLAKEKLATDVSVLASDILQAIPVVFSELI